MAPERVVIVGAGHAGVQLADSLRREGFSGKISLITDEVHLPYQRPPLSKDFMAVGGDAQALPLRGSSFYSEHKIDLRAGTRATAIDRVGQHVHLSDGTRLPYDRLVLATGASNRQLLVDGVNDSIQHLRTVEDAEALRRALDRVQSVLVVGAGFIGLEFASAAVKHDVQVTVLEFAPRVMERAVSPLISEWFQDAHAQRGMNIRLGEGIVSMRTLPDGWTEGVGASGEAYRAQLIVVGVGVLPNTALALECGLAVDNGIVVNAELQSSDPSIYAIGDCANFPSPMTDQRIRLESVQNAVDQAKTLACTLTGTPTSYSDPPWFWSQQGDDKLQIVGLVAPAATAVVRGNGHSGSFSVFSFTDRLVAVESVNNSSDHLAARRIFGAGLPLSPEQASNPDFDLRAYSKSPPSGGLS